MDGRSGCDLYIDRLTVSQGTDRCEVLGEVRTSGLCSLFGHEECANRRADSLRGTETVVGREEIQKNEFKI